MLLTLLIHRVQLTPHTRKVSRIWSIFRYLQDKLYRNVKTVTSGSELQHTRLSSYLVRTAALPSSPI